MSNVAVHKGAEGIFLWLQRGEQTKRKIGTSRPERERDPAGTLTIH